MKVEIYTLNREDGPLTLDDVGWWESRPPWLEFIGPDECSRGLIPAADVRFVRFIPEKGDE